MVKKEQSWVLQNCKFALKVEFATSENIGQIVASAAKRVLAGLLDSPIGQKLTQIMVDLAKKKWSPKNLQMFSPENRSIRIEDGIWLVKAAIEQINKTERPAKPISLPIESIRAIAAEILSELPAFGIPVSQVPTIQSENYGTDFNSHRAE
jgi:hypothetical protein